MSFWVLSHSSKSAFSRHDNVRTSSTLFIWLSENVRIVCLCKREQRPKRKETDLSEKNDFQTRKGDLQARREQSHNRARAVLKDKWTTHKLAVTSPKVEGTPHKQEETTYKQGGTPHKQERATCKQARATPQASGSNPTSKGEQPHKQGGTTAQPNGECFLRKGKRHAHAVSAYKCKLWPIRSCLVLRYL